jgi:hypothetical protein
MQQLQFPPIVLECPSCGEKYLVSNESNILSEKATLFTDGFYFDEQIWRTPGIIGCVTCELGFFPHDGKIIATPDWDDYYLKWGNIKKAEPPSAGALALELRIRRNMNIWTEKVIRKEFWYAANHTETGRALLLNNEKFKNVWINSLTRYEEILDLNNPDEIIIKAEINRNLGRFEICLSLLEGVSGVLPDAIRNEAIKGNCSVIQLTSSIEHPISRDTNPVMAT